LIRIPEPLRGNSFAIVEAVFTGTERDGAELLAPLRAMGPDIDTFTGVGPMALTELHMDPKDPIPAAGDGIFVEGLPLDAIDAVVATAVSPLLTLEIRPDPLIWPCCSWAERSGLRQRGNHRCCAVMRARVADPYRRIGTAMRLTRLGSPGWKSGGMDGGIADGRLAELTIALSLATDLGTGQPVEHGLRTCWLSLAVADALGLDAATRSCVYYVALLRFVGCTADASETAELAGGDDLVFNATMGPMLGAAPGEGTRFFVRHLAEDLPWHRRAGRVARALADPGMEHRSLSGHCEVAARLGARLGLPDDVCDALAHAYERWDGKGHPSGLAGERVPVAIRVVAAARDAELWSRAGWGTAADVLAHRRGRAHDPTVVDALLHGAPRWLDEIGDDPGAAVLDAEPAPVRTIDTDHLDAALHAVADFADLKSPYLRGHSTGVAALTADAARAAGLSDEHAVTIGRAGLVHDVGRVGVASGIWDRRGPLSVDQWERVRMHPYLTERVLRRCSLLAPLAEVASCHHERADGSGYHRGAAGGQLPLGARLLAAADAYHAMCEERPHRPALAPSDAAERLLDDVDHGRFARAEVDAVLAATGQPGRQPQVDRPAGLTEREVDVLRLIARGLANKDAAAKLGIAPKTVGHHVEHIYTKTGVTTRAGATLFAMEHGLLSP
jgi:HD-GYP domain-containing protein (c-di-GMP phosphodiesterase class II)